MMQGFNNVTLVEGRKMIKLVVVLLLPNWGIADAVASNAIKKKALSIEEKKNKAIKGVKYNEDHVALLFFRYKGEVILTK